jgi:hypothetical protein
MNGFVQSRPLASSLSGSLSRRFIYPVSSFYLTSIQVGFAIVSLLFVSYCLVSILYLEGFLDLCSFALGQHSWLLVCCVAQWQVWHRQSELIDSLCPVLWLFLGYHFRYVTLALLATPYRVSDACTAAAVLQFCACIILAPGPPFPVMVLGQFIMGISSSFQVNPVICLCLPT